MSREEAPQGSKIYTLRVELEGSAPPIWRRFKVIDQITLATLHETLQVVMGWEFDHLNAFTIDRKEYGVILDDAFLQGRMNDESEFELRDLVKRKGKKFKYLYDFGDDWLHEIRVEDISEPEPGVRYPVCVGGDRNCPPEDCGGIYGYYNMLDAIKDPEHEQYKSVLEWLGDEFDPDAFDIEKINASLDRISVGMDEDEWDDSDEEATARDYKKPVSCLLTLGEPDFGSWRDYAPLGIGPEHIPDLILMATDDALHEADSETLAVWAPVHAWRALGQLRAEEAIAPLIGMFYLIDEGDDWASEDLPHVLEAIGPAALPALGSCLQDASWSTSARATASETIAHIGQRYPETRAACVTALVKQLERFAETDGDLNGLVMADLVDLKAVEAAPVMERAFAANAVDLFIIGDWQDAQIALGLIEKKADPPDKKEKKRAAKKKTSKKTHGKSK